MLSCTGFGGLAQLVRASASHAEGRRFESATLHHIGASFISLAPTFLQKSEQAHAAAPPFQIEPASLGFDLVNGDRKAQIL